jgi:hypothetical protein
MNDAEPRAGEHGDRKLRQHRHVDRDAVSGLQAREVAQERGELVDADVELLVRHRDRAFFLELRNRDQRGLVLVLRQVAVDAVAGDVELAADEPLPERRLAGVEDRVPPLVPGEHLRVFLEAFREVLLREAFVDRGVLHVRLRDEAGGRRVVLLFLPMDRDLRFGRFGDLHRSVRVGHGLPPFDQGADRNLSPARACRDVLSRPDP